MTCVSPGVASHSPRPRPEQNAGNGFEICSLSQEGEVESPEIKPEDMVESCNGFDN